MRSRKFLIAASINFAERKVEMVSTFRLTTILFAEFFGQSNLRISPASLDFFWKAGVPFCILATKSNHVEIRTTFSPRSFETIVQKIVQWRWAFNTDYWDSVADDDSPINFLSSKYSFNSSGIFENYANKHFCSWT